MLEGLHSADAAVQRVTWSWVKAAVSRGGKNEGLTRLLQPVLKILLEPRSQRRPMNEKLAVKITLSREDAERDMDYARYYFESLGIDNPYAPTKREQYSEALLCYSRQLDSSQLLYAMSLLQSVISVDPKIFVCAAGNVMVDVSSFVCGSSGGGGGLESVAGSYLRQTWECSSSRDKPQSGDHRVLNSPSDGTTPQSPSPMMHKNLLELILSACTDMLRSEYHPSLKVSARDQSENLEVKVASASLLSTVLQELLKVLAGRRETHEDGTSGSLNAKGSEAGSGVEWKVFSPSFVSALIALCDVQLMLLLLLGKSVQWWEDAFCSCSLNNDDHEKKTTSNVQAFNPSEHAPSGSQVRSWDNPLSVTLHSLCSQLLRAVQCLIVLDSQLGLSLEGETRSRHQYTVSSNMPDLVSITSGVKLLDISGGSRRYSLPSILPSSMTASQPYFKQFLLHVLRSSSLSSFHDDLLHMFSGTISNFLHHQLLELAPNLVKQLCANIERVASPPPKRSRQLSSKEGKTSLSDGHFCVIYLNSILDIIWWCLFGKGAEASSVGRTSRATKVGFTLLSRLPNPLYSILQVMQAGTTKESLTPTLKQPSAMSWLLGVFSASQKTTTLPGLGGGGGMAGDGGVVGEGVSGEGVAQMLHGVDSLVGQHMLMLLPAIYNAMASIWTNLYSEGARRRRTMERRGSWRKGSDRGSDRQGPPAAVVVLNSNSSSVHKESIIAEVGSIRKYRHILITH